MNIVLLAFACCVALARPIWGFAIYLLCEHTLFWLGTRYTTVLLPAGSLSAADALPVAILVGAFAARHSRFAVGAGTPPFAAAARSHVRAALVPFFCWVMGCFAISFLLETNAQTSASEFFRHFLNFAIPWALFAAVWQLREQARSILTIAIAATLLTSAVHFVLMVLDLRGLFPAAYFGPDLWSDEINRKGLLLKSSFIRFYPAGLYLMVAVNGILMPLSLMRSGKRSLLASAGSAILAAGICVSFMRSAQITLIFSLLAALAGALWLSRFSAAVMARFARIVLTGALAVGVIFALNPHTAKYLMERYTSAQSEAQGLFDPATVRGVNNRAALESVQESPIVGHGGNYVTTIHVADASVMHDVHPFLQIALYGGAVGLALLLAGLGILTLGALKTVRDKWSRICQPELAASAAVGVICFLFFSLLGYTGLLVGRGGAAFAITVGFLAAEWHNLRLREPVPQSNVPLRRGNSSAALASGSAAMLPCVGAQA